MADEIDLRRVGRPMAALSGLYIVYVFNFIDRQVLAVLIEPIRADIAISDAQAGLLVGTVYALFYTILSIPVAMFADRTNRVRLVAVSCTLFSLFTAACGMASNLVQLALARAGVGVGQAGGAAPSLSIIADYFPPERRAKALSVFTTAIALGTALGTALAGGLGQMFGWRAALQIIGGAGLLAVPILIWLAPEPRRGTLDAITVHSQPLAPRRVASEFWKTRSLRLLSLAGALSAFAGSAIGAWTPTFLVRNLGADLADVALYYSLVVATSLMAGSWAGGWLVDRLGQANPRAYALVPAGAMILAAPPFAVMLAADSWQWAIVVLWFPMALGNAFLAPMLAIAQNLSPAVARATMTAILLCVVNLAGMGLGPLLVGILSDALAVHHGAMSLPLAMAILPLFMLIAAAAYWRLSIHVAKELAELGFPVGTATVFSADERKTA